MVSRQASERLIKYGFYKDSYKDRLQGKSPVQIAAELKKLDDKTIEKMADHEAAEQAQFQVIKTEFPKPMKRYRLWWENFNLSIEEAYFWVLDYMRTRLGMPDITKTEDVFSAAENSAFFGVSQQRIGLQQDKVSQFLATIGKMVKELFQLVRELRIIDERMDYYKDSYTEDRKKAAAAEITLKGIYIDIVEQGAKNPASVYGMARELQFATLPDLFFSVNPRSAHDVNAVVDQLMFNDMVKRVLKRKLYGFLKWKEQTYKELKNRRDFTLKYLNQHWEIIRMYMNWVRPYLRHIKRLTMDEEKMKTPDLITAFEGSMVEIEFLAHQLPIETDYTEAGAHWNSPGGSQNKYLYSCIVAHFLYRTRPAMSYQQEGYQRGPVHVGRMQLELRSYVWNKEQIDNYVQMKEAEDIELMETISGSVKAAMEALGEELLRYLEEAKGIRKTLEPKKETGPPRESALSTIMAPVKGVGELFGAFLPQRKSRPVIPPRMMVAERLNATSRAKWCLWETYKNFKREHKMLAW